MTLAPKKILKKVVKEVRQQARAYAGTEERPLGSYATLMAAYASLVAVLCGIVRLTGRSLPEKPAVGDLALIAVAAHKAARQLAKDPVTSPLRAPFTTFSGQSGEAEVAEEVRGTGTRKAMGELVTCPFCLAQWVVTVFGFGLILVPRLTRFTAGLLAALTAADFLQFAYAKAQP